MKNKEKISLVFAGFLLILTGIFAYPKIGSVAEVLGAFDPPYLWPSARTAIALWMNASRYGTVSPMDKTYIMNFWASHYDILLDGQPYGEVKALNPNIGNMTADSAGYGTMYTRPESATGEIYWGKLGELKTWVEAHWQDYPAWSSQFSSAADALEDCFIHVNHTVTARFTQTAETYTIPAYDPANPKLSRLPASWDIDYDWLMNVGSPVYVSFWRDYQIQQLGAQAVEAVFLDSTSSSWINLFTYPAETVEYNVENNDTLSRKAFADDIRILTGAIQTGLHNAYPEKKLSINNGGAFEDGVSPAKIDFQDQCDLPWRENGIHNNRNSADMKNEIEAVGRATAAGKIVVEDQSISLCDGVTICPEENPWDNATCMVCINRERIAGLSAYYQMMNDNVYYAPVIDRFYNLSVHYQEDPAVYSWFGAMGYDIGRPAGDYDYDWVTGQDPSQPSLTYYVFARRYTKALVLFKAKPAGSPAHGVYGDNTATTHQLEAPYRRLNADGTLGDPITSVTLRNWEGAILLENDTTAPAVVDLDAN